LRAAARSISYLERGSKPKMAGIGFGQAGHEKYAGPGHWNDPDMLVVGYVGWSANVRPTHLTPSEQYTHISLWCLLCSPLLSGKPPSRSWSIIPNLARGAMLGFWRGSGLTAALRTPQETTAFSVMRARTRGRR
jgi:hypothetical protein